MFHVDNNSAVPVMPAIKPVVSATPSFFTEGGNGIPPTYPGPDWFNIIQSELLAILKAANINPDKASTTQLLAAMKALFLDASQNGADIPDKATFLQNLGIDDVIHGDWANIAGFLSGDKTKPYFRHTGIKSDIPLQLQNSVLDELSGKTQAQLRTYLELQSAAQRSVGTGADQIPDMSSFTKTLNNTGYQKLPGGLIIQWGRETIPAGGIFVNFPISFPNAVFSVALGAAGDTSAIITANGYQNNGFSFSSNKPTVVPQTYIAVGY